MGADSGAGRRRDAAPRKPVTFDDVLSGAAPAARDAALALRRMVCESDAGLEEGIYGGAKSRMALYSLGGSTRVVCGIQPSRGRCLFYIHRVEPDDVPELRLAGKGKHARHIAFTDAASVPRATIRRLVRLSIERLPPVAKHD